MKSPFPGMDPFIEACGLWADFHVDLIVQIKRGLARLAPERYLIRAEERSYVVFVESEGKKEHPFVLDISVTTPERRQKPSRKKEGAAVAEVGSDVKPVVLRAFIEDRHREAFVEIYETTPEQRLVTTIEVLSPSNKRPNSPGWDLYVRKREGLLLGGANLIEIDLLRGGQRMPMLDSWPVSPYTLMVARANEADACLVWPGYFQKPLPPIPVPLSKPDADLHLDLQPLIETLFEESRYAQVIDYRKPLSPALSPEEAAWLKQQLKTRRK